MSVTHVRKLFETLGLGLAGMVPITPPLSLPHFFQITNQTIFLKEELSSLRGFLRVYLYPYLC